jgi:2-polyprenyl-3-methyl-5-hydroxy-6-metoxy-1,4-benzoquinol methylase
MSGKEINMPTSAKFWDKVAKKYAASTIKNMPAYEYTLGRTRSYLSADTRALEIGCGSGSTALLLAPQVAHITGTDISPEMVRIASEKAAEQGVQNATFEVAEGQSAASDAGSYDAVLGYNIFHLTENPERLFTTIHDQLAPGGLFISKTPCLSEPSIGLKRFAFAAMIPVMQLIGIAPFVGKLSFARLEAMVEGAGFEIIETISSPAMSRFIVARRRA